MKKSEAVSYILGFAAAGIALFYTLGLHQGGNYPRLYPAGGLGASYCYFESFIVLLAVQGITSGVFECRRKKK